MFQHNRIHDIIKHSTLDTIDTKILIMHATKFTHSYLIANPNKELTLDAMLLLTEIIKRRQKGEPISYILGYKEFYGRRFKVTKDTLIPRPETELLVDIVLSIIKPGDVILDLGTGGGVIAITLKLECDNLNCDVDITALDYYPDTLKVAKDNGDILGANVKYVLSNWFDDISCDYPTQHLFNIIVSNPPYIAPDDVHLKDLSYEPKSALTDNKDGYAHITHIIKSAHKFLKSHGYVILEHGYNQAKHIQELFKLHGYDNIKTIKDYGQQDRITMARIL